MGVDLGIRTTQGNTFAPPTQHLRRFMFGFRLKAKPEHEAAQVLSWRGEGRAVVRKRCVF